MAYGSFGSRKVEGRMTRGERILKFIFGIWVLWVLFLISGIGIVIYVLAHFLSKFW